MKNNQLRTSVLAGVLRQFLYLVTLVLIVLIFWKTGDVYKSSTVQEYGIFESAQSVVLLVTAIIFLIQARWNTAYRPILICLSMLALAALVREQDAYFDDLIPYIGWTWCWAFPVTGIIILLRNRQTLGETLNFFLRSNAFHMMMTAMIIIIPVAQCLGHRSFLVDLMGDTSLNSHLMRRILEEPIELLGYFQILLASIECIFELKSPDKK